VSVSANFASQNLGLPEAGDGLPRRSGVLYARLHMNGSFYRDCALAFLNAYTKAWRDAAHSDDLLSKIRRTMYDHGTTTAFVDVEGVCRTSSMQPMGAAFELQDEVIERGDAEAFRSALDRGVVQLRQKISELLFKTAGAAAESVGNSFDCAGRLTGRMLCDMIEKMDFSFNENGSLQMPTFVCGSDAQERIQALLDEPDVKLRLDVILREKWMARYTLRLQ
jgi:hypothetical protein